MEKIPTTADFTYGHNARLRAKKGVFSPLAGRVLAPAFSAVARGGRRKRLNDNRPGAPDQRDRVGLSSGFIPSTVPAELISPRRKLQRS